MIGASINLGSRVYLRFAVAGEPGCVCAFDKKNRACVEWIDLPEVGRTWHDLDNLIVDEAFTVRQLDLFEFEELAA